MTNPSETNYSNFTKLRHGKLIYINVGLCTCSIRSPLLSYLVLCSGACWLQTFWETELWCRKTGVMCVELFIVREILDRKNVMTLVKKSSIDF